MRIVAISESLRTLWRPRFAAPALLLLAGLSSAPTAFAIPTIDTTGASFGGLSPFGEPNTATYGQTFTATGPETQLDSFSFRFDDSLNPDFVDFAAYVYAWDGTKATGGQLYASSPLSSTNNGGAGGFELFSFATGGIQLSAGQQYVAFLNASGFFDGSSGISQWQLSNADAYAGGAAVWYNNGANFAALTSNPWDNNGSQLGGRDLWFRASFSTPVAVPEPASMLLLLSGLALCAVRRRRLS